MGENERSGVGAVAAIGWPIALMIAAVDGRTWSPHTKLTITGCLLEASGIVLLTWDLIGVKVSDAIRGLRAHFRNLALAIRAALAGPRTVHVYASDRGVGIDDAVVTSKTSVGSIDDPLVALRLEFELLRNQVADLEAKQRRDDTARRQDLASTRARLELRILEAIAESRSEHFTVRLSGFAIALVGSVVLACANFF